MKKIFIIICGIFITLLSNPVLAQADPGDDPDTAAPIDDYIWVLAAIGLVYVFLRVRAIAKKLGNTPQE
jgi:hypothetical protein